MAAMRATGSWSRSESEEFLRSYRAPIRLAVVTESGFPLICSLWFSYEQGRILCATRRRAKIVECLEANPRCAFELAPNEPPYFGVRGQGTARISSDGAMALLEELVVRYLGDRESRLARWLLGRDDEEEVTIAIEIDRISSWDYRERMAR